MLDNFSKVFDATNKGNDEIIFAVRYLEGEATNNNGSYTYSNDTGQTAAQSYREDGSRWNDPLGLKNGYNMSMEYQKVCSLNLMKQTPAWMQPLWALTDIKMRKTKQVFI